MERIVLRVLAALVVLAALTFCLPSQAQIGISPQKYDLQLDSKTRTHTFRLFNFSDEPRELQVTINHWRMDESNQVEVIPPTERSLDQWIIMNPLRFTLPPRESQAVRFAIRPAIELAPGEYRAMIYFTEVLSADQDPTIASIRSRMRIGAAIYAQVGRAVRRGTIDSVTAGPERVSIEMTNTGSANTRLIGDYRIVAESGATAGQRRGALPQVAVLPGDTRTIPVAVEGDPLAAGRYIFSVAGQLGEQRIERSWTLDIP